MSKSLVVDDNPAITRLLDQILSRAGYAVRATNRAEETLPLVHQEQPDLVVLDICMPGMDGGRLCSEIRQQYHTPVLVLSVLNSPQEIERTLRAGAVAHMGKPFLIDAFLDRVSSLLRGGMPGASSPIRSGP